MTDITVLHRTQHIEVNPATASVSVINAGPQGPAGAPGESDLGYEHSQPVASDTWIINHNLGYKPIVSVHTVGGLLVLAGVLHVTDNQLQVNLAAPMAGFARLK